MRRVTMMLAALLSIGLVLALVACSGQPGANTGTGGGSTGGAQSALTIVEKDFAFSPASAEVNVGDAVTFTNEDSAPHEVRIDGQDLGSQNQGDSVTWTASKTGTFPYSCTIYPSMVGEITVK